jgi:hypothetical protein
MADDKKEPQGLSLRDIANFGEDVPIGDGKSLRVRGISAQGCLILLIRFPDLQKWLAGKNLPVNEVFVQAPDTIAAIIAAGTGTPGDPDDEAIAATLPVEVQMDVMEAIYRLTFRSGFGPFAQRVLALYGAAVQSGNFGVDPATKSPQESKPSSLTDTATNESGTTPPGK